MANATAFLPFDMTEDVWFGSITNATPTGFIITDGFRTAQYTGTFTYPQFGPPTGIVTGIQEWRGGVPFYAITDAAVGFSQLAFGGSYFDASSGLFAGDDTFTGSDGDENIWTFDGADLISGGLGNDTADAGAGNDTINGEDGNDLLRGGDGDDELNGGPGADVLDGGSGKADTYNGGAGDDTILLGGNEADVSIDGGAQTDTIVLQSDITVDIFKPNGVEQIDTAGFEFDRAHEIDLRGITNAGVSGVVVNTSPLSDIIWGTDSNDVVNGSYGNDTLNGGEGNDTLVSSFGADILNGGPGDDTLIVGSDGGRSTFDGGAGIDTIQLDSSLEVGSFSTPSGVERIFTQGHRIDVWEDEGLTRTIDLRGLTAVDSNGSIIDPGIIVQTYIAGMDIMFGTEQNDTLHSGWRDDTLYGGGGDDSLNGGRENDQLFGGGGNDLIHADDVEWWIPGGNDTVMGGSGADTVFGGDGDDELHGDAGADSLLGGEGDDEIYGGNGADTILGSLGDDVIEGGEENDRVLGEGGQDGLYGEAGDDALWGDHVDIGSTYGVSAQVYRLYAGLLDRTADYGGHAIWTQRIVEGNCSLEEACSGFVNSSEFQNIYGDISNAAFVTLLFQNVLNRDPGPGAQGFINALNTGALTREGVALQFSESQEFVNSTAVDARGFIEAGSEAVWVDDMYRLYLATLDREPDESGLLGWIGKLGDGQAFEYVITGFVNSVEFQTVFFGTTDTDFVTLLYDNVLDRIPSGAEVIAWLNLIAGGRTREEVVIGFSNSPEFQNDTDAALHAFVRALDVDDVLNGGSGGNVLVGGALTDEFIFEQAAQGTHTVVDMEGWDTLVFEGFSYVSNDDVRAKMTQSDDDVLFEDQGVTITIENMQLGNITDYMILV